MYVGLLSLLSHGAKSSDSELSRRGYEGKLERGTPAHLSVEEFH